MKNITFKKMNRIFLLILMDVMSVMIAAFLAIFVRFDFLISSIPGRYLNAVYETCFINIIITLVIFYLWQLYKSVWRYASTNEVIKITGAVVSCTIAMLVVFYAGGYQLPRSYPLFYGFFLFGMCVSIRFGYRFLRIINHKRYRLLNKENMNNCLLVGAGAAGNIILKEIESSQSLAVRVCCIIDDNPGCHGKVMRGIPVVGGRDKIALMVEKYEIDEIIIAIPSASPTQLKAIIELCKDTGCKMRILPAMHQLISGQVSVSKLRDVQIEDLLGRDPVNVCLDEIIDYVKDRVVLVTGGGGSIGSELCRQIARFSPKLLLIVDIYENNIYEIQQELKMTFPELNMVALIASVRDKERIEKIYEQYKPELVYHAAAHKHVPLMEDSPNEAIKNNVFGTYNVVKMAHKYGVRKFVMISTDKAVNPTNIMGASKRICEMIIQSMNRVSNTDFVAVRFGNVLGSNGSVIPLFKKQIAEGGPVTVTHPDIIRYFMTIPEAVSLVLQAGAYAQGGEIFVLDMGEPVKIDDLAKNLIQLSGYRLGEDIEIVYTGLRPGEKMYEELLMGEEGLQETENHLIHIGKPIDFDEEKFGRQMEELRTLLEDENVDIRKTVKDMVPTYQLK